MSFVFLCVVAMSFQGHSGARCYGVRCTLFTFRDGLVQEMLAWYMRKCVFRCVLLLLVVLVCFSGCARALRHCVWYVAFCCDDGMLRIVCYEIVCRRTLNYCSAGLVQKACMVPKVVCADRSVGRAYLLPRPCGGNISGIIFTCLLVVDIFYLFASHCHSCTV